ncbi:MAG: hypothetical protein SPL77_06030 [Prevotella sp.]|nr:hypothetical protein [Prevotella sp.]
MEKIAGWKVSKRMLIKKAMIKGKKMVIRKDMKKAIAGALVMVPTADNVLAILRDIMTRR